MLAIFCGIFLGTLLCLGTVRCRGRSARGTIGYEGGGGNATICVLLSIYSEIALEIHYNCAAGTELGQNQRSLEAGSELPQLELSVSLRVPCTV
jgi:hypothetical protein